MHSGKWLKLVVILMCCQFLAAFKNKNGHGIHVKNSKERASYSFDAIWAPSVFLTIWNFFNFKNYYVSINVLLFFYHKTLYTLLNVLLQCDFRHHCIKRSILSRCAAKNLESTHSFHPQALLPQALLTNLTTGASALNWVH